jgi:uncharacterized protein YxeA
MTVTIAAFYRERATMTDKLYYVKTLVSEYDELNKNLPLVWFKIEDARDFCNDEHLKRKLFTAAEAKRLKAYLDRKHGYDGVTTIHEAQSVDVLPPAPNRDGKHRTVWSLFRAPDYKLPFKAQASLDVSLDVRYVNEEKDDFKPYKLVWACIDAERHISKFTVFELHRALDKMHSLKKVITKEFKERENAAHREEAKLA